MARKLQAFDDDDIVRYTLGHDVPIVGLVRDRLEYREMREIALINGVALGLPKKAAEPAAQDAQPVSAPAPEAATASATVAPKPEPPVA